MYRLGRACYACIFGLAFPNLLRAEGPILGTTDIPASVNDVLGTTPAEQPAVNPAGQPALNPIIGVVPISTSVLGVDEMPECKTLAGSTGKLVQIVLFLCCCLTLCYKFRKDAGGRSFQEFALDSSKQLFGAGWIHMLNLWFAQRLEGQFEGGDECHWYWVNIVVDCTLGVVILYLLFWCFKHYLGALCGDGCSTNLESGQHYVGEAFSPRVYMIQLIFWLFIVSLMKLVMVVFMMVFHGGLIRLSNIVLLPFQWNSTLTLLVVMIVTPFCMNSLQLWIVDNFIKKPVPKEDDTYEAEGQMKTRIQHGDL